tara:strand:- start:19017 stop:19772 length:756 start_codon:yes stop_codon:yes gene_type:complete
MLGPSRFLTTRWSVVLNAGGAKPDSPEALEALCTAYWRPIHGFIRRRGHDQDDARDLTQGFFAQFLERLDLRGLDPARGRFRAYLLACVKHFLANEHEKERALKRGGGERFVDIEFDDDAGHFEPTDERTPEREFERQWAHSVLRRGLERLRLEQVLREGLFDRLKPTLAGESVEGGYAAVADEFDMTSVAVKVAVHRLKKRYAQSSSRRSRARSRPRRRSRTSSITCCGPSRAEARRKFGFPVTLVRDSV